MDPFHHPSSVILAGPMPPLRSCCSGSLLSSIVLTQNIFLLPSSLICPGSTCLLPAGLRLPLGRAQLLLLPSESC